MKAITVSEFGPPSVLKLKENLEIPKPSDNEVLIEVKYIGVNPVETYIRADEFDFSPPLPWVPGGDCSGIILELGPNSQNKFSVGQHVYTTSTKSGAYASHTVASMDHVHTLPDKLSFQQGAALGIPYFTAYSALFERGQAKPNEIVLIHGASGAVGIGCIQMAKAHNLTVIGTAGTDKGLELIKDVGADYVFNHRKSDYIKEMKEKFENKINLIIEMLADKNLVADCELAAFRGRIMIVGCRDSLNFDPRLTMGKLLDIRGIAVLNNTMEQWQEASLKINEWMINGVISPKISKEYNLADANKAHHDIILNSGTLGKLILKA